MSTKEVKLTVAAVSAAFLIICLLCGMICENAGLHWANDETELLSNGDFIRFHIVANSNSEEDQRIKLNVRDYILKEISPELAKVKDIRKSRQWLNDHREEITALADSVLSTEGVKYNAVSKIGFRWIPVKRYSNAVFPAGNYEAFTIELGEAKGENWWCVMYPPLCLVGENPEEYGYLADYYKGTEYEKMMAAGSGGTPYILKSKALEIGKDLLKCIKKP